MRASPRTRELVAKEVRVFFRDTTQWSQLVLLGVLAITGSTMMKGDRGITGRGKYFIAAGLTVPVGFIIYMHA